MNDHISAMRDAELTKLWREIQDTSISSGGEPHLRFARAVEAALSSTTGADAVSMSELPGMWDRSDLTGGATDCSAPSDLNAAILALKPIDAPGLTGNHIRTHRGGFAAGLRAAAALVDSKLKEPPNVGHKS